MKSWSTIVVCSVSLLCNPLQAQTDGYLLGTYVVMASLAGYFGNTIFQNQKKRQIRHDDFMSCASLSACLKTLHTAYEPLLAQADADIEQWIQIFKKASSNQSLEGYQKDLQNNISQLNGHISLLEKKLAQWLHKEKTAIKRAALIKDAQKSLSDAHSLKQKLETLIEKIKKEIPFIICYEAFARLPQQQINALTKTLDQKNSAESQLQELKKYAFENIYQKPYPLIGLVKELEQQRTQIEGSLQKLENQANNYPIVTQYREKYDLYSTAIKLLSHEYQQELKKQNEDDLKNKKIEIERLQTQAYAEQEKKSRIAAENEQLEKQRHIELLQKEQKYIEFEHEKYTVDNKIKEIVTPLQQEVAALTILLIQAREEKDQTLNEMNNRLNTMHQIIEKNKKIIEQKNKEIEHDKQLLKSYEDATRKRQARIEEQEKSLDKLTAAFHTLQRIIRKMPLNPESIPEIVERDQEALKELDEIQKELERFKKL
ncbi:MAG: hypothetical protein WA432_04325 [Candidatus Babeliaceae bacterium]